MLRPTLPAEFLELFFCLFILAYTLSRRTFLSRFPVRCPREAARCKLPFSLRPGLSQGDMMRTKEPAKGKSPNKERTKEIVSRPPNPHLRMP